MSAPAPWESWKPPRELARALPRPVRLTGEGIAVCLAAARSHNAAVRRVLAEGQETEAVVTGLGRGKFCLVDYRFTAGGREYDGSARIARPHWDSLQGGRGGACQGIHSVNRNLPPEGSLICVLPGPDDPRRHIAYPANLAKVAAG